MDARAPRDVLQDHLTQRQRGDLESDLARNYAPDVVLLTMEGIFRGHDGVRKNQARLRELLGETSYDITNQLVEGRFAFIEWRAHTDERRTCDGTDGFVIEDGKIVCQTIRYTVHERQAGSSHSEARSSFDARVVRRSGANAPRYLVEFLSDDGATVTVEQEAAVEEDREQTIARAMRLVRGLADSEGPWS